MDKPKLLKVRTTDRSARDTSTSRSKKSIEKEPCRELTIRDFSSVYANQASVLLSGPNASQLTRLDFRERASGLILSHRSELRDLPSLGKTQVVDARLWPIMYEDIEFALKAGDRPSKFDNDVFRTASNQILIWIDPVIEGLNASGRLHEVLAQVDPSHTNFTFSLNQTTVVVVYSRFESRTRPLSMRDLIEKVQDDIFPLLEKEVDKLMRHAILKKMGGLGSRLAQLNNRASDLERQARTTRANALLLQNAVTLINNYGVDPIIANLRKPSDHVLVASRKLEGGSLKITTVPMTSTEQIVQGTTYGSKYLGTYEIAIDLIGSSVRYRNIDPPAINFTHPHHRCLSGYDSHLSRAFGLLDFDAIEAVVVGFLSNFDADDSSAANVFSTLPANPSKRKYPPSRWVTLIGDVENPSDDGYDDDDDDE